MFWLTDVSPKQSIDLLRSYALSRDGSRKWRTVIETWDPPNGFVDSQHKGPYRSWWHQHSFRADGDGTIMEDHVYYAPPLGILGRIANRLFIARTLRGILEDVRGISSSAAGL